jgi:hypothetical protein
MLSQRLFDQELFDVEDVGLMNSIVSTTLSANLDSSTDNTSDASTFNIDSRRQKCASAVAGIQTPWAQLRLVHPTRITHVYVNVAPATVDTTLGHGLMDVLLDEQLVATVNLRPNRVSYAIVVD